MTKKLQLTYAAIWDELDYNDKKYLAEDLRCSIPILALKAVTNYGSHVCTCKICMLVKKARRLQLCRQMIFADIWSSLTVEDRKYLAEFFACPLAIVALKRIDSINNGKDKYFTECNCSWCKLVKRIDLLVREVLEQEE